MGSVVDRLLEQDDLGATREALPQTRHLPGRFYTSPELQELEKRRIFMKDWLCVARLEELSQLGDYMAIRIMDEPVLITRDQDGALHALANVCRHRGVEVAQGQGNATSFSCPYHSWNYDLTGRLVAAPYMRESTAELGQCRLPPLRIETWRGWIFLNFDANAPPLSDTLAAFDDEFGFLQPENCRLVDKTTIDLNCNWKFTVENLMDVYHVGTIHNKSFGKYYKEKPDSHVFKLLTGGGFSFFFNAAPSTKDGKSRLGKMPWLGRRSESFACLGFQGPNINFNARCDMMRSWVTWPLAPNRSRLVVYTLFPEAALEPPGLAEKVAAYVDFMKVIVDEDRTMVESLQNGVASSFFAPGPMSRLEGPIHHLVNAYLDRLDR